MDYDARNNDNISYAQLEIRQNKIMARVEIWVTAGEASWFADNLPKQDKTSKDFSILADRLIKAELNYDPTLDV